MMIRTFVAVPVPITSGLAEVFELLGTLGPQVRPVRREALHVTLKFLGEMPEGRVGEITATIARVAARFSGFELQLQDVGRLPSRRPRVVFADLVDPDRPRSAIIELASALEEALAVVGFAPEKRPFRPHVTLARIRGKPPIELEELQRAYDQVRLGTVVIDQVELVRSELGAEGPRYSILATVKLGEPA